MEQEELLKKLDILLTNTDEAALEKLLNELELIRSCTIEEQIEPE